MIKETYLYYNEKWDKKVDSSLDGEDSLVIIFGSSYLVKLQKGFDEIISKFSNSIIIGCSTAGEIYEKKLYEHSLSVVVMKFEKTKIKLNVVEIENKQESFTIGSKIANSLLDYDLEGVFVLSDGLNINGSKLVSGFNDVFENSVSVTGGLAGDDDNFIESWIVVDGKICSNYVTAVGFYGENIHIGYGAKGGWNKFGMERSVTFSDDNILYELDDKPALDVYKKYLGDQADELPKSALFFPLLLKEQNRPESVVRTVLSVNESQKSITFAGDIPNGYDVTFLKSNSKNLINGAVVASNQISKENYENQNAVNLLISSMGRKMILEEKIAEEIEAVRDEFSKNENVSQIGYYSYGQISPLQSGFCGLHNQTVTMTFIWES